MELFELEQEIRDVIDREEKEQCIGRTFYQSKSKEKTSFHYPNAESLITIFLKIKNDSSARLFFIQLLKESIIEEIEYPVVDEETEYMGYVNVSTLSFYVLVRLRYVTEALDALNRRYERSSLTYLLIYCIVDSGFFNSNDLKEILDKLNKEQKPPEPIEGRLWRKLLRNLRC